MNSKQRAARTRALIFAIICISGLILIGSSIVLLISYVQDLRADAAFAAQRSTSVTAERLRDALRSYELSAKAAASAVENGSYKDETEFQTQFQRTVTSVIPDNILFLRYFNNGNEYRSNGDPFDKSNESQVVLDLVSKRVAVCAGVVDDREFSISTIPVCVPIYNCPYADAMVIYYHTSTFSWLNDDKYSSDYAGSRLTGICSASGETIAVLHRNDFEISQHNNIYEVLRSKINDKSLIDSIKSTVNSATAEYYDVTISDKECIVAVESINEYELTTFFIVGVYNNDELAEAGYDIIRVLLGIFAVLFVLLIVITVVMLIKNKRDIDRAANSNDSDDQLGCPTRSKFERTATDIINRNKATQFAVIAIDVNHYDYLNEQNGHETLLDILQHLKLLYSKLLQIDETYGYLNSGRFVLLLHYREMDTLAERLNHVSLLASAHGTNLSGRFPLELIGGICCVKNNVTNQVSKMIDLAIDAEKTSSSDYDFGMFRIYNERIHASRVQNDYIELHMESALEHKDFRVFYQPKFHIFNNVTDGAEALVRWYNPELDDYMQPGVFLPLFEANRFIVKVDRYVYEQVCTYIEEAIGNNLPIVPISVNVSRITAADSDFVSYYTAVKQQHGIPDGFIMIEFTESFAYEDYDMLREIVTKLHDNGFKCSIDDFGSGFSSYNILKELPMDEIKLDRFFIKEGFERDRDLKILKSVIELGRALNMKVTQEGVETIDQLALLRSLGCHVIQGYHYSKPLSLPAFMEFLESKGTRTHNSTY
ncbi:MAG: EAL domain-containing protein [Clostridia bacterium]|nr:EAL domain-containing protein [Clostridia bacterium]